MSGSIVDAYLKTLPQGALGVDVAKLLKEHCADFVQMKKVESELHDLKAMKSNSYDPASDAFLGVDVSVEMLVDNRLGMSEEYIEQAILDELGQWSSLLSNSRIEMDPGAVNRRSAAGEFCDFVHFLQQQVEPHQIRRSIADEHKKTTPPISLDLMFDLMDKSPKAPLDEAAHFAFVITELNSLAAQFKPAPTQEQAVSHEIKSKHEPQVKTNSISTMKLM